MRLVVLGLLAACAGKPAGETGETADPVETGETAETGESSDTGETADTTDSAADTGADSGESGETGDTADSGDTSAPPAPFYVVFAGNLTSGGPCDSHEPWGCDLFRAELDPESWAVLAVEALPSEPDVADWFPAIDRDGRFVAYERMSTTEHTVMVQDPATGASAAFATGRYPDFAHHDDRLTYDDGAATVHVAAWSAASGLPVATADEALTPGGDPSFLPDDDALLLHRNPDGEPTRVSRYDLGTGAVEDWSPVDGCGHASVAADGTLATCELGNGITGRAWDGAAWGEYDLLVGPLLPAEYGARYDGCELIHLTYPELCRDGDHVAVAVTCLVRGQPAGSGLFVYRFSTAEWYDLHGAIEVAAGVSGTSTVTAACTPAG